MLESNFADVKGFSVDDELFLLPRTDEEAWGERRVKQELDRIRDVLSTSVTPRVRVFVKDAAEKRREAYVAKQAANGSGKAAGQQQKGKGKGQGKGKGKGKGRCKQRITI